jgi:hypothetical protein
MNKAQHSDNSDMTPFMHLYDKMKDDSLENGVNMFNENNENVNTQNMFSYFYQFIKKYIIITKNSDKIIDI